MCLQVETGSVREWCSMMVLSMHKSSRVVRRATAMLCFA